MAATSIFDCDSVGTVNLPRRQLVTYDDDDLFSFGCDGTSSQQHDEIDNVTENLRIKFTFDNKGDKNRHKRKRFIDNDDDGADDDNNVTADKNFRHEQKKKRISSAPSCSSTSTAIKVPSIGKVLAKNGAQPIEKPAKATTSKKEPYTKLEQIGEGTYGRVYKGQCNETHTMIAIKQLTCKLNTPNTVRKNFVCFD